MRPETRGNCTISLGCFHYGEPAVVVFPRKGGCGSHADSDMVIEGWRIGYQIASARPSEPTSQIPEGPKEKSDHARREAGVCGCGGNVHGLPCAGRGGGPEAGQGP